MMENAVEVRIRSEMDDTATHLTVYPIDRLEELIRIVSSWGVYDGEGVHFDASGQFVADSSGAHFEIIVGIDA